MAEAEVLRRLPTLPEAAFLPLPQAAEAAEAISPSLPAFQPAVCCHRRIRWRLRP